MHLKISLEHFMYRILKAIIKRFKESAKYLLRTEKHDFFRNYYITSCISAP